ncbi:TPA: hypothetical protein P0E28_005207, partial [Vibrio campbellii]|nr:hypothetical protein [Vibrio campbellii]
MSKVQEFRKQLDKVQKQVEESIEKSLHEEVESGFLTFMEELVSIGPYSKKNWHISFTSRLWEFFAKLAKYENVSQLLHNVDSRIGIASSNELEALEFVRIELLWGNVSQTKILRHEIERLVEKYPYNLEFVHALANVLISQDEEKFTAIRLYRQCIDAWGKDYNDIVKDTYNYEMSFYKEALESGDYLNAEKQIDYIKSYQPYKRSPFFNNNTLLFQERLKDRKFTEALASKIERELKESVNKEYEGQNKKNLENLGVFSAIITFIITAAASAYNADQQNTPLILLSIGLILILFMTSVMLFNDKPQALFKDFRFYLLVAFLSTTIYTVYSLNLKPVLDIEVRLAKL